MKLSIVQFSQRFFPISILFPKQHDVLASSSVEELLLGMASQIAEREDVILCSDIRDKLFGPMDFSRRDLGALNIMRGRDNGLPDYNTVRNCFGLDKVTNWTEINPELFKTNVSYNFERICRSICFENLNAFFSLKNLHNLKKCMEEI